jgi:hypothetical protein
MLLLPRHEMPFSPVSFDFDSSAFIRAAAMPSAGILSPTDSQLPLRAPLRLLPDAAATPSAARYFRLIIATLLMPLEAMPARAQLSSSLQL